MREVYTAVQRPVAVLAAWCFLALGKVTAFQYVAEIIGLLPLRFGELVRVEPADSNAKEQANG
jgi:hypothetical protein